MMSDTASANVARFLAVQAREQPAACALKAPLGRDSSGNILYEDISFSDLHAQSEQVAHGLTARGIRAGTRVLLMVRPGSDLIRCCFALFKVGAVPVVIDPGMGLRHFLACVKRTRPEALLGIPLAHWISRIFPGSFKTLNDRIQVESRFADWYGEYPEDGFPTADRGADDLAAILFTSGSTGPPKGVCYGHGQFDSQVNLVRESFDIKPGEVDLPMLPVFALFNPALGMTTVVPEINPGKPASVQPSRIVQAIEQCGVTNSFGAPILWAKIADYLEENGKECPTVKRILMAGAPVSPGLVKRMQPCFPKATMWSPYGATECLPVSAVDGATILQVGASKTVSGHGTCVGSAVSGVQIRIIRIVDGPIKSLDQAEVLSNGEIGEILATGPSVTKSYDALPEATQRAKIVDGQGETWHRMGDAGYLDEDGLLWFCGRIAERVHTRDGVLYSDCCEGIFNALPGVRRSALIGLGKAPEQVPAIVIDPVPGQTPGAAGVLEQASKFELTRSIKIVFFNRKFPVDVRHNAKINRITLAMRYQKR